MKTNNVKKVTLTKLAQQKITGGHNWVNSISRSEKAQSKSDSNG